MKASLAWIRQYVPELEVSYKEFMDAMTLSGTKVESYEALDKNLEKIVVGQIVEIAQHPDADKLVVCQVNIGTETLQIVTGAPNVEVGQKVPVVLDGGRVAGGHDGGPMPENGVKIKRGKLRGVESNGMMCSIEELGSSRDMYPKAPESGIYILDEDAEIGSDAVALLGLRDAVFEFEVTSNRVDCYSVLGIAREAAATFRQEFKKPDAICQGNEEDIHDYVRVTVEDKDLCPRYCARGVKNIKIGPSPEWFQRLLAKNGHRPISNLVDITNFVMDEYGQPMHAFDMDTITGRHIIVKRAAEGDSFVTLDGKERKLDSEILTINDAEKAIGLAGIMGGENSKITDHVQNVLFESACFDGTNNRLSAKRLGMRTDASAKYEKGVDPNICEEAVNRACELVELLGCGEVIGGMIDVCDSLPEKKKIPFRPDWINGFLGTDIPEEEMLAYFKPLEFDYDEEKREVTVPTWRKDMESEADLSEEVARFYGYDNIPTTLCGGETTMGGISLAVRVERKLQDVAEFCGFSQAQTYSFESPKAFEKLLVPEGDALRDAVVISNPLGEDFSIMRTQPLNGILTSLATNYNRRNRNVRLYELAKIYLPKQWPLTELPDERVQMTMAAYGDIDFFAMKGVVEEMLARLGLKGKLICDPKAGKSFLHPGRGAKLFYGEKEIGYMGELHPAVSDNYEIGDRVNIAVLDLPVLTEMANFDVIYENLAVYPEITRDISLIVDKKLMVGELEKVIEKKGGKLLESYHLFDVYEDEKLGADKKSVAYSMTFRSKERTLLDEEATAVRDKIIAALAELGAELRR